ncbi:DUF2997 domain-containing protein [bacterium]|nr:DUF2997 domain-containing protein [bacterium]
MADYQYIDVTIKPDGKIDLEVSGVKGKKCLDLTKGLEDACGGKIESRQTKREYDLEERDDNRLTDKDRCRVKRS